MAQVFKNCNSRIAHLDGVTGAVVDAASAIQQRARAVLAAHRDTGEHHVELHLSGATDALVILEGRASLAVERGHYTPDGTWVEGLHVLRDAVLPGG